MAKKEELTGFKKFAKENRSLLFTIPVFVVLLVVVLFVYVFNGDGKTSDTTPTPDPIATATSEPAKPVETDSTDNNGTEVTTLPDTDRDKDGEEILRNPFSMPYKVSGIIYDSKGDSVAIIEAEDKSYILKVGDKAENYFSVLKIEKYEVTIEVNNEELTLSLYSN